MWLYLRIQHKKQIPDFLVEFLEIFSEITTNAPIVGTTYKRPVIAVEMQLIPTAANFPTIWSMGEVLILVTIQEDLTATNLDPVPAIIMVSQRQKHSRLRCLLLVKGFCDLFLFGLVWQCSTNQNQYDKGRFKVMATYL